MHLMKDIIQVRLWLTVILAVMLILAPFSCDSAHAEEQSDAHCEYCIDDNTDHAPEDENHHQGHHSHGCGGCHMHGDTVSTTAFTVSTHSTRFAYLNDGPPSVAASMLDRPPRF